MVANFDQSTRKLINSSKSNPCPVCGRIKDGDCRISHDGKMVLCHQNFDHAKTQQPDVWHFDGTSSDNRCGVYVYKEPTTKSIRPKQTRYWEYPARDGSRLVRVCREDDGEGKKKIWQERWDKDKKRWLPGLGKEEDTNKVDRASIPIYRYAEVREAIAKGEPVHTVEGEPCADIFWKLGLAATTNIGGGGKFTQSDAQDLQGAEVVVIVPDRDKKGIDHAEKVAEYFPDALWLYPFPESKVWENLPKDHGLDIADWVEHHNITAEDIKAAIGCKKLTAINKSGTRAKLSMREAAEQARQILRSEQDELTTNIKLEEIRQTAGISEYVWEHKIVKPLKRDMDAERFKLELLGLLQMDDAVERYRQIALLAPKYSMSAGTIKEAMAAMKSRTQTAEVQVLSFDDLLASESEALEWTVQELLPVGETVLFVALPKVGKSKAAVDLAFCVATGESRFLGREVRHGKVLLISPDASKQSLKHEMLKRGFRSQDGKNIRIIPRWSIDQMSVLEKELEDFRPDLVIIDSLKKITAGKEISENSAEFADNIIALNDMLGRYRASGVLIHHASKSNEAVGVAKARGSTAIVGACWGVWDLERIPKPDPNNKKKMIADPKCPKRIFTATSRDSEGLSLNIEFNPENNSFDFISEVGIDEAEAQQQQSYAERILGVLRKNQRPISGPELMELMGIEHKQKGSVYSALGRMESKRLISSKPAPGDKRYNLYSLPDFSQTVTLGTVPPKTENSLPPPPPIPTVPIADYVAESFTQYGFDNSQQNSQQIVSKNSECAGSEIAESITLKSVDPIVSSSTLSQGGEGVKCVDDALTVTSTKTKLAQAQPSELPESTTESPAQIALLVERVKAAQTWAEVEAVWGADLQLKAQIKAQLPEAEFKRVGKLYKQVKTTQKAITLVSKQQPVPEPIVPPSEPMPQQQPGEPEPIALIDLEPEPEPETITPEDAEKMREIATVWWDEFYSEQLQNLLTQMFGWDAPGTKYCREAITRWLEGEDSLVGDRLDELWRMKHGEGLVESPDCGF
jgi:hypothetical protein